MDGSSSGKSPRTSLCYGREVYAVLCLTETGTTKPFGLSQGMHGLFPWQMENARSILCAAETATLAGEMRSPHTPHTTHHTPGTRSAKHEAPGPAGDRQGATGVRCGAARPVDGPRETALGLGPRAVTRGFRRRKQLRGAEQTLSHSSGGVSNGGRFGGQGAAAQRNKTRPISDGPRSMSCVN